MEQNRVDGTGRAVLPMERPSAAIVQATRASDRSNESKRRAKQYRDTSGLKPRPHPCTSDTEYTEDQQAFLKGVAAWKVGTGRQFPTLCEILDIAESLGWARGRGWPSQEADLVEAQHEAVCA